MKVRFNNPAFIVYKFKSFKAFFCLSSQAGRGKVFYGMATQEELS